MSQHQPPSTTAKPTRQTERNGTLSLDIEVINLVPEPDVEFKDPTHWSLFCIPLGYRNPDGTIETTVLFRTGMTPCEELNLLEEAVAWIRNRRPAKLLTYNGTRFDLPILKQRARVTAHECPGAHPTAHNLELLIETVDHVDVFKLVKEQAGCNVPLDSALKYHGIETVETQLNGQPIDGSTMPDLGKRMLRGTASPEMKHAITKYAKSDVKPLFELESAVTV